MKQKWLLWIGLLVGSITVFGYLFSDLLSFESLRQQQLRATEFISSQQIRIRLRIFYTFT